MIDELKTYEILCPCRQVYVLLLVCVMLQSLFLSLLPTKQTDHLENKQHRCDVMEDITPFYKI